MYYYGIVINQNLVKAKKLINSMKFDKNGRGLFYKSLINNEDKELV